MRQVIHNHFYRINNSHTVREGAISSANIDGLVYVDHHIRQWDTLPSGWRCHNWKYLAKHELVEKAKMLEMGFSKSLPRLTQQRIYSICHTKFATPAEEAEVRRDGGNVKEYTHHMDGLLARIENEAAPNPPPDPFIDPAIALETLYA